MDSPNVGRAEDEDAEDTEERCLAQKRRAGDGEESEDLEQYSQPRRASKRWKPAIDHTVSDCVQRRDHSKTLTTGRREPER